MEGKSSIDLTAIEPDKLYPGEQAGALVGRSQKTLANDRSARKGAAYIRLGGRVYYRGADLLAEIERARVDPNAPIKIRRRGPM